MERSVCISCLLFIIGFSQVFSISYNENTKRYQIYWDHKQDHRLRDPKFVLPVEIGQFMDIICPMSFHNDPQQPNTFDLHNVTEEGYVRCDPDAPGSTLIFSCNMPAQENKLTIKFQTISPSPFGFRFRHCEEYYFIAIKREPSFAPARGKRVHHRCTRESERLRIKVACPRDKTTTTITSTTTTTSTTLSTSRLDKMFGDVVVPSLDPVESEQDTPKQAKSRADPGGENGSTSTTELNLVTLLFLTMISTVWILTCASP